MKNMHRITRLLFLVVYCFSMGTTLSAQTDGESLPPLKEGMARIILNRHSGMAGGAIVHAVVDRYDTLGMNAFLIQKNDFPQEKSNFDKAQNVISLYVLMNAKESKLVIGKAKFKVDIPVGHPFDVHAYPMLSSIPGPLNLFLGTDPNYYVNSGSLVANVKIVGCVASGGTVAWDRPSGKVKIEEITPGGDQAFAPVFTAEAGKTYKIDYYYMKARFDIKEVK